MQNRDNARHFRKTLALPALTAAAFAAALLAAPALASAQSSAMAQRDAKAETHAETIDQRISTLHEELKITQAEESDWNAVAQTMRANADAMEKLASEKQAESEKGMTAVEDLQTYSDFAQAHVEHLKKLTAAFETLYNAMPEQQKKLADQVFAHAQHNEQTAQPSSQTNQG